MIKILLLAIENLTLFNFLDKILLNFIPKFEKIFNLMKIEEICNLFYILIKVNKNTHFAKKLADKIITLEIPKNCFCTTFWAFIQVHEFDKSQEFLDIIYNMKSFGEIKYFFNHDNYIMMIWTLMLSLIKENNCLSSQFNKYNI